jgi:PIN domain nuclease of toxin-antitoxin system
MSYLIDTHVVLWAIRRPQRLSAKANDLLLDLDEDIFVSAISAYEIANKHRLGKLGGYEDVAESYGDHIAALHVAELPITTAHALLAARFAWDHRDPFDRILAAQASVDGHTLITDDGAFATLPWLTTLWA